MFAFRRAALRLYSLAEADKNWLLSKLSKENREKIVYLLHELEEMGIPKNQSWLSSLEKADRVDFIDTKSEKNTEMLSTLDRLDPRFVYEYLEYENDSIVTAILTYKNWAWKEDLLAIMDKQRRKRLRKIIEQAPGKIPIIIQNSLILAFDKRIRNSKQFIVDI
ncbi:MAG: hypothetical protein KZQ88_07525 [Candidatus Thiodiazotropha sp. (ex Dulcina madagascariensis)]|nr:hypothetical protein [Candidatus Thiodiazotropha sp. (ex Dulcina madagascariensis)]MCU7925839.1 hypothetical protein [Candidatus Thiodiazotropha sp. (ex Dulcina madagascariensis)]